ncbi:MAG: UTRA domain-containing protein, partial [Lacrimispora sphenoides]
KSETAILKNKRENISGELAKKLNLNKKTEVLSLERLRKINGEAVILDKDYLIAGIIPEIPLSAAQLSIYNYIENDLGLNIGYANKEINIEPITEEDRILLDIHNDTHVAVVRSEVYLEDTRFFQYHESRQRVDTFRFVDFARRKNIVDF